jgi:predicted nucleic acid-binding protein
MKRLFILDTNVWLAKLRGHPSEVRIRRALSLDLDDVVMILPAAVAGELRSIALQQNYGKKKMDQLDVVFRDAPIIHTNNDIIDAYVEIDAFSQGKHPSLQLGASARNMGKNDIWIAATAKVANAALVTFDKDFDHLHEVMRTVHRFDAS